MAQMFLDVYQLLLGFIKSQLNKLFRIIKMPKRQNRCCMFFYIHSGDNTSRMCLNSERLCTCSTKRKFGQRQSVRAKWNQSEWGSGSGLRVGHPLRMRAAAPTQAGQVLFRLDSSLEKVRPQSCDKRARKCKNHSRTTTMSEPVLFTLDMHFWTQRVSHFFFR